MTPTPIWWRAFLVLSCCAALLSLRAARADEASPSEEIEAVYSMVSNGYVRAKLPDGSFKPESYVFEKGEFWAGEIDDASVEKLTFKEVAQTIARPLASQDYVPSDDPKAAQLLIVVHWGTTMAPEHRSMSRAHELLEQGQGKSKSMDETINHSAQLGALDGSANTTSGGNIPGAFPRGFEGSYHYSEQGEAGRKIAAGEGLLAGEDAMWRMASEQNARMLGYTSLMDAELQRYRYFVVLMAYDFQVLANQKKTRLLWETRFSISKHRNQFDKQLAAMLLNGSKFLGQDSHGLVHRGVPEGRVEIGEVRSLDAAQDSDGAALAPDGFHLAYLRTIKSERRLVIVDVDRPESLALVKFPTSDPPPTRLTWSDSGHVVVTLSSAESLSFDADGKRLVIDEKNSGHLPPSQVQGKAPGPSLDEVQALAEGKLPDREVMVLGSDETRHRFLLLASGGAGAARYFVLDVANDLLFEVGRKETAP